MLCSGSMSKSLATAVQWYGQERINQIWVEINTLLAFSPLGLISIIKIRLALSSSTSLITIQHHFYPFFNSISFFQLFFYSKAIVMRDFHWYATDLSNWKRIKYKGKNKQLINEQHASFLFLKQSGNESLYCKKM